MELEKKQAQLSELNAVILQLISEYLDLKSFISLKSTARYISTSLEEDCAWKAQTSNFVPIFCRNYLEVSDSDDGYKLKLQSFISVLQAIREYLVEMIVKKDAKLKADSVRDFLRKNFNDSTEKETLDTEIKKICKEFDLETYFLYRLLNGEDKLKPLTDGVALFGGYAYYHKYFDHSFLPFGAVDSSFFKSKGLYPLVVQSTHVDQFFINVDMINAFKQGKGTLSTVIRKRAKPGTAQQAISTIYVWKRSVLQLLRGLKDLYFDPRIALLSHLDTLNNPSSDVTTQGIRVRGSSVFSPTDFEFGVDKFVHCYQIRISPNGVQGKWRLTTRHWTIKDGDETHSVDGPGVIGYYPEMFEGAKDFVYESCSTTKGFTGSISGFLRFKNTQTNEEIDVVVGEIKFDIPKGSVIIEHDATTQEIKVVHRNLEEAEEPVQMQVEQPSN